MSNHLKSARGVTLVELAVSMSCFFLMLLAAEMIMLRTRQTWERVNGDQSASSQLLRAEGWLRRDLGLTAYDSCRVAPGLSNLTGSDGDVLWFLSAVDPLTGEFVRNEDGTPRWQRNILYYSVVSDGLSDIEFSGPGVQVDGYEVAYPYKLLVRKQIDFGPPTSAVDPAQEEDLITDITPYLERPQGLSFPADDCESVTLTANHLLSFRAALVPELRGVRFTLQGAAIEQARREFPLGTKSLLDPRFLLERQFEVFPENKMTPSP